ncbi:LPS assembly lipoprotein LptE [Pseudidiomarina sp.]|uniref:LPS-assembly lipoprotein LptE n=1 Tax=Pseudidiomarina sp. TaxID=2081707 RepID=UPI00299D6ABE|nr:LPS assembly lipoprotein LptE [Pseudidiomarina sp.]MDX1705082.1 LPS assembly lipoprotein LptE [Pseudidiomarina sp.]
MRYLAVLLLSIMLTACGFQLRDSYQLPPQLERVHIDAAAFSEIRQVVIQRFELAGAEVVDDSEALTVRIISDALDRRALSLSRSGQVAEYELIYTLWYELIRRDGTAAPAQRIEVYRDYQDDPNFALAKTREREVLVAEMREDAARLLLRQVITQLAE